MVSGDEGAERLMYGTGILLTALWFRLVRWRPRFRIALLLALSTTFDENMPLWNVLAEDYVMSDQRTYL